MSRSSWVAFCSRLLERQRLRSWLSATTRTQAGSESIVPRRWATTALASASWTASSAAERSPHTSERAATRPGYSPATNWASCSSSVTHTVRSVSSSSIQATLIACMTPQPAVWLTAAGYILGPRGDECTQASP